MTGCFFTLAVVFFIIGLVNLFTPNTASTGTNVSGAPLRPIRANRPAPVISSPQATNFAQAQTVQPPTGGSMAPTALSNIQVGQRIKLRHPQQGELSLYVMGRAVFQELWQTARGPQSPWVPTGSSFAGFWLENNLLLLNWQNRYYLLDEAIPTSDSEIGRDFAPHARKFAQSDQTAEVLFAYPPGMWKMVDIGKFRIERIEGEGLRQRPGVVGRFIHAHGSGAEAGLERALVVEDYEGGGQDMVWVGVTLQESDITI